MTENSDLFESYIKDNLPHVGGQNARIEVPRRLMQGINPQDSIEEMLSSLMVTAYSQAINLIRLSNEPLSQFSDRYEKANAEAMGFMRIFNQLSANLCKVRREKAQENFLEMQPVIEECSQDSEDTPES